MSKIKILAYGDAGQPTGFERVLRSTMDYLHDTGHFDITVYGLGYQHKPGVAKYKYDVWEADIKRDGDFFGVRHMEEAVKIHQPDVIWAVQDLWNIVHYMAKKPIDIPAVTYFPIDTPNIKWSYAMALAASAAPVAYTNFGAMETAAAIQEAMNLLVRGSEQHGLDLNEKRAWITIPHVDTKLNIRMDYMNRWQNLDQWNVIPHGLDHEKFKPMDKMECRKEFKFDEGAFIVGGVNTNQFRKRQDELLRMFAVLAEKREDARLVLYCNGSDERGWDLMQLAAYLGIMDKCYFLHEHVESMSDEAMCVLFNCFDVMVNPAGGEGWGLTSFEGAACGVPQMVMNWSATRELWKDHGILMPVSDFRAEPKFLNTLHAICDVEKAANQLIELAENPTKLELYSKKAAQLASLQPTWKEVGKKFERVIMGSIKTFTEAVPLSFAEMMENRKFNIESELRYVPYLKDGVPIKLWRNNAKIS